MSAPRLGAGPALFRTQNHIDNATAFADINGTTLNMTGAPFDFSSSKWVWGGAGQVGINYFVSPTWFVDLNYTFAMSASYRTRYSQGFSNSTDGYITRGTAYINISQQVTSQASR